jgi:hypothetical protein
MISAARLGGVLGTHLYVTCNDQGRQAWQPQHMPTNFVPLARVNAPLNINQYALNQQLNLSRTPGDPIEIPTARLLDEFKSHSGSSDHD